MAGVARSPPDQLRRGEAPPSPRLRGEGALCVSEGRMRGVVLAGLSYSSPRLRGEVARAERRADEGLGEFPPRSITMPLTLTLSP